MNNIVRVFTLLLTQLAFISVINAQDAVFSQFYSSSLYLSPCFAGVEPNLNIGVNTRTQWKSIGTPFTTHQISIIKPFYKYGLTDHNYGGMGISLFQDNGGEVGYKNLGANLSGAYNINAGDKHKFIFGLSGGVIQRSINFDKLEWGTQFNESKGFDATYPVDQIQSSGLLKDSKILVDIGAGLLYYYNAGRDIREKGGSVWLGYSAFHINRPNESLLSGYKSNMPMLSKVIFGFEKTIGSRFNISPTALVAKQGSDIKEIKGMGNLQINVGTYFKYMLIETESDLRPKDIIIGGWYRFGDSYIFLVGIESDSYTLGFSYDLNKSGLRTYTNGKGAWEVSLKIQIPKKEKIKRYYTPRI